MTSSSPVTIRPRRATPVLVCKKCLTRVSDGAKIKRLLKVELKQRASARGEKGARVVTTSCLGICPKRAVVVTSAALLHRGEYLMIKDRDAVEETIERLAAR
jgi:predicted metal-binding protein